MDYDKLIEYEEVLIFDHDTVPVSPTNVIVDDDDSPSVFQASNSPCGKLVCIFCNQDFLHESHLRDHINKVLECDYCKKWFCNRDTFIEHTCNHLKVDTRLIRDENADDKNDSFRCNFCEHTFISEKFLLEHVSSHDVGEQSINDTLSRGRINSSRIYELEKSTYECDYCQRSYRCKQRLTMHILTHMHGKVFQCKYCNKKYMYESSLTDHLRLHTGEGLITCNIRDKAYESRQKLIKHTKIHTLEREHECDFCGRKFLIKSALSQHLRTHDPSRVREKHCNICGNDYPSNYFSIHQRTHSGEKPYQCDICDRSFAQPSGLWEHRAVHDIEKKHKCPCGKHFSRKKDLKRHAVKHTGKGFVCCKHCGKAFSSNWLLKNHERKHTGERPFACMICGDCFTQKANLATHLRIHTGEQPFACEYCGRQFSLNGKLKQHLRIHTGEKPYVCEFCDKRFRQLSTLRTHILTHTEKGPFKCDCCGRDFKRKLLLIQHIGRQHVLECYY